MENETNELTHWGIKGQKWGIRRYQNKDGTLTAAGRKRYNKELEKLEKQQQVLKNKQATKAKLDKLDDLKRDVEARKQTLNGKKSAAEIELDPDKKSALREKVLKSTDPKELYKHRDLLSTAEINERLTRLDTEKRLGNVATADKKSFNDRLDKFAATGEKMNKVFNVVNGPIGKAIAKKLGFGSKEDTFDFDDSMANLDKMSGEKVKKFMEDLKNRNIINNEAKKYEANRINEAKREAERQAKEAAEEKAREGDEALRKSERAATTRLHEAEQRVRETEAARAKSSTKTTREEEAAAKRELERAQDFFEEFVKSDEAAKWLL